MFDESQVVLFKMEGFGNINIHMAKIYMILLHYIKSDIF